MLTVSATVTFAPGHYGIEICRSVIDPAVTDEPAFTIAAPKPSTIQPDHVYRATICSTFVFAEMPKNIIVYFADGTQVARRKVAVTAGSPPTTRPAEAVTATLARVSLGREATGWSRTYDFDEALADAVSQLRGGPGSVASEVGFSAKVADLGIEIGGLRANTGLYVTLRTV
jgi:hypothetical protein